MGSTKIPKVYGRKFDEWVKVVCRVFMVPPAALWSARGRQRTAWARHLLYSMIFADLKDLTETAAIFNRTHGAVWHGIRNLKERGKENEQLRGWVEEVGSELNIKMFS